LQRSKWTEKGQKSRQKCPEEKREAIIIRIGATDERFGSGKRLKKAPVKKKMAMKKKKTGSP